MSFLWPAALALLLLIPVGIALDRRLAVRRRARLTAAGMGSLPVQGSQSRAARLRRRIPPVILLAGITLAIVALARPEAVISVPRQEGVVVLAFDVSGSMAATDLQPTRMAAARAAAKAFVERQPDGVVIGVVAFSDGGISVQIPTRDQSAVRGSHRPPRAAVRNLARPGDPGRCPHDRRRAEPATDRLLLQPLTRTNACPDARSRQGCMRPP